MLQLVLAAPRSGSGKTTAACALLAALTARGLTPCAFKSGPDYIDPMFHRAVLGVESHNLDLFFSAPQTARALYARHAAGHGAAVVEGAMGYYDGLGGVTDTASAWQLADTLDLPALLVVRPKGASLTLAAELRGLTAFRTPHHIAGILLNDCTQGLCALLKPMLEKETGLPVVGCLPPLPEAAIESRHLGLKTAAEIDDLQHKIQLLSDAAQQTIDWPLLHTLFDRPAPAAVPCTLPPPRVRAQKQNGAQLLATGEMGIGNTTTSSAVASVLLGRPVAEMTGRGAGLSDAGLHRKIDAIERGIARNHPDAADPLGVLAALGGFDIAGLCGVFLGGALERLPIVMDGFISGVAALCAVRLCPAAEKAVFASHVSSEPAAHIVLDALCKKPLITAELHLGEGTGAVASLPLWDMALAVYNGCYSFAEGGITPYTPQC